MHASLWDAQGPLQLQSSWTLQLARHSDLVAAAKDSAAVAWESLSRSARLGTQSGEEANEHHYSGVHAVASALLERSRDYDQGERAWGEAVMPPGGLGEALQVLAGPAGGGAHGSRMVPGIDAGPALCMLGGASSARGSDRTRHTVKDTTAKMRGAVGLLQAQPWFASGHATSSTSPSVQAPISKQAALATASAIRSTVAASATAAVFGAGAARQRIMREGTEEQQGNPGDTAQGQRGSTGDLASASGFAVDTPAAAAAGSSPGDTTSQGNGGASSDLMTPPAVNRHVRATQAAAARLAASVERLGSARPGAAQNAPGSAESRNASQNNAMTPFSSMSDATPRAPGSEAAQSVVMSGMGGSARSSAMRQSRGPTTHPLPSLPIDPHA